MPRTSKSSTALRTVSHKEPMTKKEVLQLINILRGGYVRNGYRRGSASADHHSEVSAAARRAREAKKRNKAYYETPTARKLEKEQYAAQDTYNKMADIHVQRLNQLLSRVETTVLLDGAVSNETKELLRTIINEYTV